MTDQASRGAGVAQPIERTIDVAKGQQRKATSNKPKLSVKEKKEKKKEKAAAKK